MKKGILFVLDVYKRQTFGRVRRLEQRYGQNPYEEKMCIRDSLWYHAHIALPAGWL